MRMEKMMTSICEICSILCHITGRTYLSNRLTIVFDIEPTVMKFIPAFLLAMRELILFFYRSYFFLFEIRDDIEMNTDFTGLLR